MAELTEEQFQELYDKGFDEKDTTVIEETEEVEEVEEEVEEPPVEQPAEDEESDDVDGEPDEDTEDESEEKSEDSVTDEKFTIKIGGQDVELTLDELKVFAQKGGDYTRKTQELAKYRAEIEAINENGLSKEDLAILADIKKGNKEALALLANNAGIDPLELEAETQYKPVVKERNYELEDVVNTIKADTENSALINNWLSALPDSTKSIFSADPKALSDLYEHTKHGYSQKIMPEVIKQMAMNPQADFLRLYQDTGNRIFSAEQEKQQEKKPEATSSVKKKASISKKAPKTHIDDHKDVWEDDELYRKMHEMLKKQR